MGPVQKMSSAYFSAVDKRRNRKTKFIQQASKTHSKGLISINKANDETLRKISKQTKLEQKKANQRTLIILLLTLALTSVGILIYST